MEKMIGNLEDDKFKADQRSDRLEYEMKKIVGDHRVIASKVCEIS
jgi:hypothetical protein